MSLDLLSNEALIQAYQRLDDLVNAAAAELPAIADEGDVLTISSGHAFRFCIDTEFIDGELGRLSQRIAYWELLFMDGNGTGLTFNRVTLP